VTWHYVGSSHRWPVSDCRGVTSLELQRENSSSWGVVPAGICQHGPGWIEFLPAFTPQVSKAPDLMLVLHAASPGQEHVSADRPSAPTLQSRKAPCYHPQLGPQGPWDALWSKDCLCLGPAPSWFYRRLSLEANILDPHKAKGSQHLGPWAGVDGRAAPARRAEDHAPPSSMVGTGSQIQLLTQCIIITANSPLKRNYHQYISRQRRK
jgi:hypothetical protein